MTSVPTTNAIRAEYKGITFRSRTEARWAVFLDELGIRWQYEAEGYQLPSGWYLPDFWLPDMLWFFEVKPDRDQGAQKAKELSETVMRNVAITNGPPDVTSGIGFRAMVVDPVNRLFADVKGDVIPWRMSRDQPWRFVKTEFAVLSGELGCFLEIALALTKAQHFSFWEPEQAIQKPSLKMDQSKSLPASSESSALKRGGPSLRDRVRGVMGPMLDSLIERWENVQLDFIAIRPANISEEEATAVINRIRPVRVSVFAEGGHVVELEHDFPYLDDDDPRSDEWSALLKGLIGRQMGWSVMKVSLTRSLDATAIKEAS